MIKTGDKVELIAYEQPDNPWESHYNAYLGGIYEVDSVFSQDEIVICTGEKFVYTEASRLKKIISMPNREYLADFIKMNNIKMTKVSQTVGKARNWLHVMVTEKRRGDLSDKALQAILKLIHIDWTKDQLINVKATKGHTAYFTRTSTYKTDAQKERLQRAMWNGEFKNVHVLP